MSENMYSSMIAATCRTFQDWKHSTKSSYFAFNHPLFLSHFWFSYLEGSVQILLLTHHWLVRLFPSAQSIPVPLTYIQEAEIKWTKKPGRPNKTNQTKNLRQGPVNYLRNLNLADTSVLQVHDCSHRFYLWRVRLLPVICLPFSRNILFFEIFRYLFLCCMLSVDWQRRFGQTNSRWGPSYRWKQVLDQFIRNSIQKLPRGHNSIAS